MSRTSRVVYALLACALPAGAQKATPELQAALDQYAEREYASAVPVLERYASTDSTAALFVGAAYFYGRGVKADTNAYFKWYKRAAELGSAEGMVVTASNLAMGRGTPIDVPAAVRWYQSCAERSHPRCLFQVAHRKLTGDGLPVDTPGAIALHRRAMALGNRDAMNSLAVLHARGKGLPLDTAAAIDLYSRSAELGNFMAAFNLANFTAATDPWTASAYAELAGHLGHTKAGPLIERLKPRLVLKPQSGATVVDPSGTEDKVAAFKRNLAAMRDGDALAAAAVVAAYQDGDGVAENANRARQSARVCAAMDNAWCHTILAQYLRDGVAGSKDGEEARAHFESAARKENTLAMFMLAEMYDKGDDIQRNDAMASYWYKRAYEKGSAKAAALLESRGLLVVDAKTQAYFDYIEKVGPNRSDPQRFHYEVAVYCKFGGKQCDRLEQEARRLVDQANSAANAANMARLWNVYAAKRGASDSEWRQRTDCMRRKTESIQRQTYGQQDWSFAGNC